MLSGRYAAGLTNSRSFGVMAFISSEESDTSVSGLLFKIFSTSQNNVCRPSSSRCTTCSFTKEYSTFLTERFFGSQIPPKWEAVGGLKIHLIAFCCSELLILKEFHYCISCRVSLSAPTRFDPLSERITCPS